MSDPVFPVGARVEFGTLGQDPYPLYHRRAVHGTLPAVDESRLVWVPGVVAKSDEPRTVKVVFELGPLKTRHWFWPLEGHKHYRPGQWQLPGYLRLCEEQTLYQDLLDRQAAERAALIKEVLDKTDWNMTKTAKTLGIKHVGTLYGLVQRSVTRDPCKEQMALLDIWKEYERKKRPRGRPKKTKR